MAGAADLLQLRVRQVPRGGGGGADGKPPGLQQDEGGHVLAPGVIPLMLLSEHAARNSILTPHQVYTVFHLLVVEVLCVLFWTQPVCMVQKQNTWNFYHRQMKDGVNVL